MTVRSALKCYNHIPLLDTTCWLVEQLLTRRVVLCGGVQRLCEQNGCELWVQKPTSRRWLCKRHKQVHWQAHYHADQARIKLLKDAADMLAVAAGAAASNTLNFNSTKRMRSTNICAATHTLKF
jgi:hypothetical protein